MIRIKRVYDSAEKSDGFRILVDKLWPRGVSKEKAQVDLWMKEIAPSDELRKWFSHKEEKWEEFRKRYREELKDKQTLIEKIKSLEDEHKTITLLYGAKDTEHNQAVALSKLINS